MFGLKRLKRTIFTASLLWAILIAPPLNAEPPQVTLNAELGFLGPVFHKIQLSSDGTYFNYIKNGGQDNLFFFNRLSFDVKFSEKHTVIFLLQPLRLETRAVLRDPIRVEGLDFPAMTPMRFLYGFPFYRVSYLRDFARDERNELAAGISLQIRNATIEFESLDGELLRANRDIGPVPILKFRNRHYLKNDYFWGSEIDGFYAPISYLNGSDEEVTGAILDGSLRFGFHPADGQTVFLNARWLWGGAVGTSEDDLELGDGYVRNWLSFLTISAGFSVTLR